MGKCQVQGKEEKKISGCGVLKPNDEDEGGFDKLPPAPLNNIAMGFRHMVSPLVVSVKERELHTT